MSRLILNNDYPSVEERINDSRECWIKDLKDLYDHAQDRFGDVSWESGSGSLSLGTSRRIWAHKAIIYSRAPKAFRERYFQPKPTNYSNRSLHPSSIRDTSPPISPAYNYLNLPYHASGSQLSLLTTDTQGTIRNGEDTVMQLSNEETPELFATQLEWLYTGEGLGDVVEWMDVESETKSLKDLQNYPISGNTNLQERREKLGQDLTYMWRSKLYSDIRIHLENTTGNDDGDQDSEGEGGDESDNSEDSLSSTAVFASHRFILVSRSPYFASLLLNTSAFSSTSLVSDISLPSPPFTPASLHFCLGYIYAGNLNFSNRNFNLKTAFSIYRSATYLQIDSLIGEIESRIVNDFAHGLEWDLCRCKKCRIRAVRIWKFAISPDVSSITLEYRAKIYLIRGWKEILSSPSANLSNAIVKEFGQTDLKDRLDLVNSIKETVNSSNVISTFQAIDTIRTRLEQNKRTSNNEKLKWINVVERMIDDIEIKALEILHHQFPTIASGSEIWELVSSNSFSTDLLENIMGRIVERVGSPEGCYDAPLIYQTLVASLLMKMETESLQLGNPIQSRTRSIIEFAKNKVLLHIGRRWMQIRDIDGFRTIDPWALKEISDEIGVNLDDLSWSGNTQLLPIITSTTRQPRDETRDQDGKSIKGSLASKFPVDKAQNGQSSTSLSSRADTTLPRSQSGGLKRLRLRSSVSTHSNNLTPSRSTRQLSDRPSNPIQPSIAQSSSSTSISTIQRRNVQSESSTSNGVLRPVIINRTTKRTIFPESTGSIISTSSSVISTNREVVNGITKNKVPIASSSTSSIRQATTSTHRAPSTSTGRVGGTHPIRTARPSVQSSELNEVEDRSIRKKPSQPRISTTKEREPLRGPTSSMKSNPVHPSTSTLSGIRKTPSTSTIRTSKSQSLQQQKHNHDAVSADYKKWDGPGIDLKIGIPCVVSVSTPNPKIKSRVNSLGGNGRIRFKANIRYIGHMNNSTGPWIGVETPEISKLGIKTLSSGVKDGILYFEVSKSKSTSHPNPNPNPDGTTSQNNSKLNGTARLKSTMSTMDQNRIRNRTLSRTNPKESRLNNNERNELDMEVVFVRPKDVVFIMDME